MEKKLYKFVAPTESFYDNLKGVFYKDGYAIASDAIVLIKKKEDYPEEYEGKIIDEDGNEIKSKREYPNVDKLFDDYKKNIKQYEPHTIDIKDFKKWYKENEDNIKKDNGYQTCVKIGNTYHKATTFKSFADMLKLIDVTDVFSDKDRRKPTFAFNNNGEFACIMPILKDNEEDTEIYKID